MKQWPGSKWHRQEGMNVMYVIKGSHNLGFANLIIAGSWKKVKKKDYGEAAIGWSIMENNRLIVQDGQKLKALDAYQAEMKAILIGIQKAIHLHIQSINIYTSCIDIINTFKCYPACIMDLVTICGDIIRTSNELDGCVIEKCNKDKIMTVKKIALEYRKLR